MKLASVIADVPTQSLDRPYTYVVPDDLPGGHACQVGCCVVAPLGARPVVGFVVALWDWEPGQDVAKAARAGGVDDAIAPSADVDPMKLRPLQEVASAPYFDEEGAACALWLSQCCLAPLAACVRLFTPPGGVPRIVRPRAGGWQLQQPATGRVDDRWVSLGPAADDFEPRKNAVRQAQVIEALRRGDLRAAELTAEFGNISSTLKSLEQKGVIIVERRRRRRDPGSAAAGAFGAGAPPQLTQEQTQALAAIEQARAAGDGSVVLLDGVTGSGKTEVYLQAIQAVLDQGKTACVLVPEISLTPQTVARFRGRFGDLVAVMHSSMSNGERFDQWEFIHSGAARVVVGARSALFTPLKNLGLVVIDEEHETTYKQENAPRYHARDVALWLARRAGAAVVLGSATPSIESLYAARWDDRWRQVSLRERANGRPLPPVTVIDMAQEFSGGSRSMFSKVLAEALEEELAAGRKAVLLLNQRGFAKFVLCRDCGFVPTCPSCSTALTYHERGHRLVCHHCGHWHEAPARCPQCESPYLKKFGAGTQRVEDELRALLDSFEGLKGKDPVPIVRMDADTTAQKGAHQRLLESFAAADAAVLLGTQMIAKGLDFDDVTLVGVINADTQLCLPDYRAAERTFDLVEQVAGRAGRATLPGRVMVQTYKADAAAIDRAAAYDRSGFLRDELPKRKMLGYPPYRRLANVLVWGADEQAVSTAAQRFQRQLSDQVRDHGGDGWQVFPATPCVLAKLRNVHRWHILVKAPPGADVPGVLRPWLREQKAAKAYNLAVDIDPTNLL